MLSVSGDDLSKLPSPMTAQVAEAALKASVWPQVRPELIAPLLATTPVGTWTL
jgi:hypothetical protein